MSKRFIPFTNNMVFTEFYFEYAGKSSRDYDLIIANVNTSEFTQASGTISGGYLFNKKNKVRYLISDDYSDFPISVDVDIIRVDGAPLSHDEQRQMAKWLFYKPNFAKFYIDDDCVQNSDTYEIINGSYKRLFLKCRFLNPIKIEDHNGDIVGYTVTMECDSGMFWQDTTSRTYSMDAVGNYFTVTLDTDIIDYTYPKVTLVAGSGGGTIEVINYSDIPTRTTKFVDVPPNAQIVMYGDTNIISDNYYGNMVGQNFIRLLDGDNQFGVSGDLRRITFEYNNRRMM